MHAQSKHTSHFAPNPTGNYKNEATRKSELFVEAIKNACAEARGLMREQLARLREQRAVFWSHKIASARADLANLRVEQATKRKLQADACASSSSEDASSPSLGASSSSFFTVPAAALIQVCDSSSDEWQANPQDCPSEES